MISFMCFVVISKRMSVMGTMLENAKRLERMERWRRKESGQKRSVGGGRWLSF